MFEEKTIYFQVTLNDLPFTATKHPSSTILGGKKYRKHLFEYPSFVDSNQQF